MKWQEKINDWRQKSDKSCVFMKHFTPTKPAPYTREVLKMCVCAKENQEN